MIVMGSSAICGGMLSLLLPETLGTQLPDTLEDTENFKKNDKGFFQCWSSATLKARTDDSNFGKKHWCNWEILIQLKIYLRSLKYRNPVKEVCNIAMWPASQPFHRSELLKICYKFLLKILGDWKIIYEWWLGLHITWECHMRICYATPFENAQRWMGKNTFHFLLLNDDNMIGEH